MKKNAKAWASAAPSEGVKYIGVTLTYRPGEDWKPRDLKPFRERVEYHLGKDFLGWAFAMEMQQRGAPHYHVVIAANKKAQSLPKPDKEGWWQKGSTNIQRIKNPKRYLLEYVKKAKQKTGLPKGARMFQAIWRKAADPARYVYRYRRLPLWLREHIDERDILEKLEFPRKGPGYIQEGGKLEKYSGWWWGGHFFRNPWFLYRIEDPETGIWWTATGAGWN